MHSAHNRSMRKRGKPFGNDNDGGLALLVSPTNASHTDFYSDFRHRSYYKPDTYIPSSPRTTTNTSWDGPSSYADSQDPPHFHPSDTHHRSARDEYTADSRDGHHRTGRQFNNILHKGSRGWTQREYDQGHSTTHRTDSQGWRTAGFYDNRESPVRRREEQEDDRGSNRDNGEPRLQGNRRWPSDNGWESRKRDRNQRRPAENQDDAPLPKVDRSWEPGPGWQSQGSDTHYRNQRFRYNPNIKNKGKKKNLRQRGDRDREHGRHPEDTLNK